jgi:hypothetical protein
MQEPKPLTPEALADATLIKQFACPPMPFPSAGREAIHAAGLALARTIVANTSPSADQSAAIRKVREAVWTADAALKPPPVPSSIEATLIYDQCGRGPVELQTVIREPVERAGV